MKKLKIATLCLASFSILFGFIFSLLTTLSSPQSWFKNQNTKTWLIANDPTDVSPPSKTASKLS